MTLLDILLKAGAAGPALIDLLTKVKGLYPDLAPEVDKILSGLTDAVSPENLIALAEALPREIADIAQGHLDPRRHPSDIA
jgi:hypothetical protein